MMFAISQVSFGIWVADFFGHRDSFHFSALLFCVVVWQSMFMYVIGSHHLNVFVVILLNDSSQSFPVCCGFPAVNWRLAVCLQPFRKSSFICYKGKVKAQNLLGNSREHSILNARRWVIIVWKMRAKFRGKHIVVKSWRQSFS